MRTPLANVKTPIFEKARVALNLNVEQLCEVSGLSLIETSQLLSSGTARDLLTSDDVLERLIKYTDTHIGMCLALRNELSTTLGYSRKERIIHRELVKHR